MYSIPNDIFFEIFRHFELKELVKMELLNKQIRKLIRTTKWTDIMVDLSKNKFIHFDYVLDNYQFIKFNLSFTKIIDLRKLKNCHTLNLYGCNKITDESVKELKNCHTLNLSWCDKITDESVKELKNCHTLDLSNCDKITDASVKEIKNCHTLNLSWCNKITDESVKELKNCHTLNLSWCNKITDESVKELKIVENFIFIVVIK